MDDIYNGYYKLITQWGYTNTKFTNRGKQVLTRKMLIRIKISMFSYFCNSD